MSDAQTRWPAGNNALTAESMACMDARHVPMMGSRFTNRSTKRSNMAKVKPTGVPVRPNAVAALF